MTFSDEKATDSWQSKAQDHSMMPPWLWGWLSIVNRCLAPEWTGKGSFYTHIYLSLPLSAWSHAHDLNTLALLSWKTLMTDISHLSQSLKGSGETLG